MPRTKIRAKKIYRNYTKKNKPYTKILAYDSLYYIDWTKHIAEAIKDGYWIVLDTDKELDEKGNMKINNIISYEEPNTNSGVTREEEGSNPNFKPKTLYHSEHQEPSSEIPIPPKPLDNLTIDMMLDKSIGSTIKQSAFKGIDTSVLAPVIDTYFKALLQKQWQEWEYDMALWKKKVWK